MQFLTLFFKIIDILMLETSKMGSIIFLKCVIVSTFSIKKSVKLKMKAMKVHVCFFGPIYCLCVFCTNLHQPSYPKPVLPECPPAAPACAGGYSPAPAAPPG